MQTLGRRQVCGRAMGQAAADLLNHHPAAQHHKTEPLQRTSTTMCVNSQPYTMPHNMPTLLPAAADIGH